MSLPEVMLVLREDGRRTAQEALVNLHCLALSAFAVWDKESGRRLEAFNKELREQTQPSNPVAASSDQLESVLTGWGAAVNT